MIISAAKQPEQFEKNIQCPGFTAQKIKCDYMTQKERDISNFYSIGNCAFMISGENLCLCGQLSRDEWDSVLSFCRFLGIYGIETDIDNLPVKSRRTMYLMRYAGNGGQTDDIVVKNENIYGFSQFSCKNFMGAAFETVYAYFAKKVNSGYGNVYHISENGKIVSGAFAANFDDDVYLTFISTDKAFRRKGLARRGINHIISDNPDKGVILMCEEELKPFYEKMGFVHESNIYLYILREEHI